MEKITENGSKVSRNFGFAVKTNLRKLANLDVEGNYGDTSILNYIKTVEKTTSNYTQDYIFQHNSIIQILCAIEKDLQDSTLSDFNKELLFKEKLNKRAEYFDFLLKESNKKGKSKPSSKSKKSKPQIIQNENTGDGKQININNQNQNGGSLEVNVYDESETKNELIRPIMISPSTKIVKNKLFEFDYSVDFLFGNEGTVPSTNVQGKFYSVNGLNKYYHGDISIGEIRHFYIQKGVYHTFCNEI